MNRIRRLTIPALFGLLAALCMTPACQQTAKAPPDAASSRARLGSGAPAALPGPATRPANVDEERWPNGVLRLQREVLRQPDGTLVNHGTFTTWYDNGQKEYEGTYVRGQLDGLARSWHRNGQQWTEEHYAAGQRAGVRYAWDEKGVLRKEEHYVDDKPDGTWTVWDEKGKIKAQQHFNRGAPLP
jgi:hypothetical protein